jgi:hypothetical protein
MQAGKSIALKLRSLFTSLLEEHQSHYKGTYHHQPDHNPEDRIRDKRRGGGLRDGSRGRSRRWLGWTDHRRDG